ncbi:hypothetical protein QZH41_013821 [Actinostola sp. cb2023]|nr:hypothetical protein QZH41_013821 [Actinostola sp. cb2023]
MDEESDQSAGQAFRKKLKAIKKIKAKKWRARKKANRKAANEESRRQKLIALQQEIKVRSDSEIINSPKRMKVVDASTQANNKAVSTIKSVPSVARSRGRHMVEAALATQFNSTQVGKNSVCVPKQIVLPKKLVSDKGTRQKGSSIKQLDPNLISRIEGIKALGTGTFGTCYLAHYRNMTVAVKEYLDNNGRKSLYVSCRMLQRGKLGSYNNSLTTKDCPCIEKRAKIVGTKYFSSPAMPCSTFMNVDSYTTIFRLITMFWTEEHDQMLCREILLVDPFSGTKKGTLQRGAKWSEIANQLMTMDQPKFKVDQRSVRERYNLLSQKFKKREREEQRGSGMDPPVLTVAVEDLIEREEVADHEQQGETEEKKKKTRRHPLPSPTLVAFTPSSSLPSWILRSLLANEGERHYNPVMIDFGRSTQADLATPRLPKPVSMQLTNKDSYIAPEIDDGTAPPSFKDFAKMVLFVSKRCSYKASGLIDQCLTRQPNLRPPLSVIETYFV